jgi:hypothetical protein
MQSAVFHSIFNFTILSIEREMYFTFVILCIVEWDITRCMKVCCHYCDNERRQLAATLPDGVSSPTALHSETEHCFTHARNLIYVCILSIERTTHRVTLSTVRNALTLAKRMIIIHLFHYNTRCFVKKLYHTRFFIHTHQPALGPRGGLWPVLLMDYIHKEGLCPSSGDVSLLG